MGGGGVDFQFVLSTIVLLERVVVVGGRCPLQFFFREIKVFGAKRSHYESRTRNFSPLTTAATTTATATTTTAKAKIKQNPF